MSYYFPKPYEPFGGDINVKVVLSTYATKSDLKNVSHVDVSCFVLKSNLANLQQIQQYNIFFYNKYNIDTTNFVKKTKYEKVGSDFEDKISKIYKKYLMLVVWLKIQISMLKLVK